MTPAAETAQFSAWLFLSCHPPGRKIPRTLVPLFLCLPSEDKKNWLSSFSFLYGWVRTPHQPQQDRHTQWKEEDLLSSSDRQSTCTFTYARTYIGDTCLRMPTYIVCIRSHRQAELKHDIARLLLHSRSRSPFLFLRHKEEEKRNRRFYNSLFFSWDPCP